MKEQLVNIEEAVKKMLYTGVGAASLVADKVQTVLDSLMSDSQTSMDEGKKIVEDLVRQIDERKEQLEDQVSKATEQVTGTIKLPVFISREDLDVLTQRLEDLEKKVQRNFVAHAEKNTTKRVKKVTAEAEKK